MIFDQGFCTWCPLGMSKSNVQNTQLAFGEKKRDKLFSVCLSSCCVPSLAEAVWVHRSVGSYYAQYGESNFAVVK